MSNRTETLEDSLFRSKRVLACKKHDTVVWNSLYGPVETIDDEMAACLSEAMNCAACQVLVAAMSDDKREISSILEQAGVDPEDHRIGNLDFRPTTDHILDIESRAIRADTEVLTMSPLPSFAGGEPDGETVVRGFRKCPGSEASSTLRSGGRRLHAVGMRVLGMFDIGQHQLQNAHADQSSTCVVILWQFPRGEHQISNGKGIVLDEMAFFLLAGDTKWSLKGGNSVRLDAHNEDCSNLLWISADPRGEIHGIPPLNIGVESDAAYGISILYDAWGVECTRSGNSPLITVAGREWSTPEIEGYWAATERHVHQMKGRKPFAERLPFGSDAAAQLAAFKRRKISTYAHAKLKRQGALVDRYLRDWPAETKADFQHKTELKILKNQKRRTAPVLDFCIVELPGQGASIPPDNIDAARHERSFEVMVPVAGEMTWYGVEPEYRDRGGAQHATLGQFRSEERHVHADQLKPASEDANVPDIFMLDSTYFHAFVATRNAVAVGMNFRCYDFDPNGERRRVRDDTKFAADQLAVAQGGR